MHIPIKVDKRDDVKAWSILVRHSPGVALTACRYVISAEAVEALREAGIRFKKLPKKDMPSLPEGVPVGQRI